MPKTKRTHLTDKSFNKTKQLADLGLTNKQLIQISGLSMPTVCRIKQASDFKDYQERRTAEYNRQRANGTLPAKKEELGSGAFANLKQDGTHEKPVTQITGTDLIIKDLFKIVQDQTSVINRMDQSLTWLAEHAVIQSVNTKRRFF